MFKLHGSDEFIEGVVCQENEIGENEMKNFDLGESKVLIVKQNGKISALGTKCSHYGAPLATGALGDGRIRCPWHGACFNITSGDIEDFPGQDSIPCYQVKIEKGQVKVRARKSELQTNKRVHNFAKRDKNDSRTFVIVGGGPSGAICAETLRAKGFTGRIVMISNETTLPYDRIKCSKVMDAKIESLHLRTQQFYDDNEIEVMTGTAATSLNTQNKEISIDNGYKIKYDKIYLATGSSARKITIPGSDLKNIFVLRNINDAHEINAQLNDQTHVVVLGVSFIGMEAAAYCVKKAAKVTVIGRDQFPLRAFGNEIGETIMKFFEEQNVHFIMRSGIKECVGDGTIDSVILNDGTKLKADILITGVGSTLNTEFLKDSGIAINKNGSIDTNDYLESNIPDVYVGGDIANSPIFMTNHRETIGHYGLAQYHGKVAASNMCGVQKKLKAVPFFWMMVFGKSFRYAGHGRYSEVKIDGSLEDLKFIAYYIDADGKVVAICTCGRDPIASQFAEFLANGKILTKAQLETDPLGWTKTVNA
ncbi:hypothetical protein PVAND_013782 [Polypedilum vanderplanki]|uniref:Rieske domain-containing protein n=1 Tax=Polypedilum vanderplanki TaxID=319348 RepID=A0A9J6CRA8_POLVA|nr:hypothetical protein PVAND_013782 [Polypedilum vanderplanki]